MQKNGQITIEAILIIGFFMLLFIGYSMPMALKVYEQGTDASVILEMRTNLDAIVGAIQVARAGGPGAVRTVSIKSNVKNWVLTCYYPPSGDTLNYFVKWSDVEEVPSELYPVGAYGGISVESIDGIKSSGTYSLVLFNGNGKGNWNVKVTNSATSTSPEIRITNGPFIPGDTIEITLTG